MRAFNLILALQYITVLILTVCMAIVFNFSTSIIVVISYLLGTTYIGRLVGRFMAIKPNKKNTFKSRITVL